MNQPKKIALITFTSNYFAFGLRSVEGYVRSLGYDVISIHAFRTQNNQNSILTEHQLSLLAEKCQDRDVVGISVISIHSIRRVQQVCSYLKKNTNAKVVLGGVPVIMAPTDFLEYADYVCIGEGESFFEKFLITDFLQEVPALGYIADDGQIVLNPRPPLVDVNQLPTPEIDFVNTFFLSEDGCRSLAEDPDIIYSQCRKKGYRVMRIRGCPHSCKYCCNNELNRAYKGLGKIIRITSVEKTIEELLYAKQIIPGLDKIYFLDDDFLAQSLESFTEFIEIYRRQIDLPIWEFSCTFKSLSENKLEVLLQNNIEVDHIRLGIQAPNKRVNKEIYGRFFDKEEFFDKIEMLLDKNIVLHLDMILNNPYETIDDWAENLSFCEELGARLKKKKLHAGLISFSPFDMKFYPGTELYQRALHDGIIDETYVNKILATSLYGEFNKVTIYTFLLLAYKLLLNDQWRIVTNFLKQPSVLSFLDSLCKNKIAQVGLTQILLFLRKTKRFVKSL